jgi:CheY-like chemotaxis protein
MLYHMAVDLKSEKVSEEVSMDQGRKRVLVVDDELLVRNFANIVLRHCGYEVVTAGSGAEAMKIFLEPEDVHLVLTDVHIRRGMTLSGQSFRIHDATGALTGVPR